MSFLRLTRRDLLAAGLAGAGAGGAGLALGIWYGRRKERWAKRTPPRTEPFSPNIYLAISEDGAVRIWLTKAEMGQGVMTSLPAILADALDADWSRVEVIPAIGNRNYGNMLTASSSSVRTLFDELRAAGGAARVMLLEAAAETWGVEPSTCETDRSVVIHGPTGRRLTYGALASAAARQAVPGGPTLAPRAKGRLVGRTVPRVDIPAKVTGAAQFAADVRRPGMLRATVRHPPPGASLRRFDPEPARAVDGVLDVVELDGGAAVVAANTWSALEGARELDVEWTVPPAPPPVRARLEAALERGGVRTEGSTALPNPTPDDVVVERTYYLPYLAHAQLEPTNATAWVREDACEVWAPTQSASGLQGQVARHLGIDRAQVIIQPTLIGGGFGRRIQPTETLEAVELSRRMGRPVQVTWSREEDTRRDAYRPASLHRLRAKLDGAGRPTSWHHAIASHSLAGLKPDDRQVDPTATPGAEPLLYSIPAVAVEWCAPEGLILPVGFWRSVGHSFNAFAVECFVDELSERAGLDPVVFRRSLLEPGSRARAVLDRVAEMSAWEQPPPDGRARGLALHECFESYIAVVVEVELGDGGFDIPRVFAAVDCGLVIDPGNVRAQIEGGIVFGLSAARWGRIDLGPDDVVQSNFHDIRISRLADTPAIELSLIEGAERPGGVGELGVPAVAPALANAWARLEDHRPRDLPLQA